MSCAVICTSAAAIVYVEMDEWQRIIVIINIYCLSSCIVIICGMMNVASLLVQDVCCG